MLKEHVEKRLKDCLECEHTNLTVDSTWRHGVEVHRAKCADCGNAASAFGEGFESDEHATRLIDLQMEFWAAMHPRGKCECGAEGTCDWCTQECPGCGEDWIACRCQPEFDGRE